MNYKPGILLGKITKPAGFEGAVLVRLEKNITENIPQPESVFLLIEGRPVPFLVDGFDFSGAGQLRISFKGYPSHTSVEEFRGCSVFLTTGTSPEREEPELPEGFSVYDKSGRLAGTVASVIENPGQLLLVISSPDGRELLVPLHEDLIISADRKKKILVLDIPEGLSDLNP